MKYAIKATAPDGKVQWCARDGLVDEQAAAFRYNYPQAAYGAALIWQGVGTPFWESEREAAKRQAEKFKGWNFDVIQVAA